MGALDLLTDPALAHLPTSYNLLPQIIDAKYLDAMDAEH